MNTSQLAALRWMMERELSALRSPRMSPEISLKCPDENELASRLSERAVDERLTARRVERIRDLENALRRIEVMDYGVCEACGEPIPLLRLLASPSVRYCVACQQELEEEERAVVVTGSWISDTTFRIRYSGSSLIAGQSLILGPKWICTSGSASPLLSNTRFS